MTLIYQNTRSYYTHIKHSWCDIFIIQIRWKFKIDHASNGYYEWHVICALMWMTKYVLYANGFACSFLCTKRKFEIEWFHIFLDWNRFYMNASNDLIVHRNKKETTQYIHLIHSDIFWIIIYIWIDGYLYLLSMNIYDATYRQ